MPGQVVNGGTPVGVPIPPKRQRPSVKRQSSGGGGNSGTNKHRGETNKQVKEAQQLATKKNQRTLHLEDARKRTWRVTPAA